MVYLFDFVKQFSTELANLAKRIEDKMFSEPHASLMQARLYSEHLVKTISKEEELEAVYPLKHAERIHKLYRQNVIEEDLYMKFEWIRKKGNKAAHDVSEVEVADMLQVHKFLFEISVWYMQVYVTYTFEAPAYKLPINVDSDSSSLKEKDMDDLIKPYVDKKLDDMWSEIQRQLDEIRVEKEGVENEETNVTVTEMNRIEGTRSATVRGNPKVGVKTIEISDEIHRIFTHNHFALNNKTKKAAEYEQNFNKEIVYLLPNKRLTIVLHPETVNKNFETPAEPSHSTALRRFPKNIRNGKTPINYGYSFKFESEEELNDFLKKISTL